MTSKPFVSIRKYIKRGDEPPYEETNTFVLTSSLKYYVDLRLLNPLKPRPAASQLQWASAGPSLSTSASVTSPAHTKWTHWVDSTTLEEFEDEGWMHPIEGTNLVLEKGEMDFKDGKGRGIERFEEMWEDLEGPEDMDKIGWVLQTEGGGGKGMCIRVGMWAQGFVRMGSGEDVMSIVRWKLNEGGNWAKEIEIGEFPLRREAFDAITLDVGDVVQGIGGLDWKCIESSTWE